MTPDTFIEHFATFAAAPNGVAKLRELILQLAVQGKLVPQDENDQPTSVLVKQIAKFREEATGRAASIAMLTVDDLGFPLPTGWIAARFGDLMVNRDGERIPVSRDIREGRKGPYDYYGASGVIDCIDEFLFDKPLLLIGEDGANLINRSTPIAFIAQGQYWVNNHAHVLDGISLDFLRYIELHINAIDLKPFVTGTAQPKMNQAKMNSIPIAVPPLAEQRRIVGKVDQLLGLCDELASRQESRRAARERLVVATLDRLTSPSAAAESAAHAQRLQDHFDLLFDTPTTIPHLRQAILQLAVQGQLVPQDPNDEPVEKRPIKPERKKGKWEGPIDEQELPFPLPPSWMWFRLGDISMLKHGYAFSSTFFTSDPAPFVLTTPGNFYEKGGFRDRESKRKYYSGPVDPEFILQPGDLIVPMTEQAAGLLGSPAFIPNDGRVYIHNQRLGKLNFSELIAPEFAFCFFNSEFFRGELDLQR